MGIEDEPDLTQIDRPFSEQICLLYDGSGMMVDRTFIMGSQPKRGRNHGVVITLIITRSTMLPFFATRTKLERDRVSGQPLTITSGRNMITNHVEMRKNRPFFAGDKYKLTLEDRTNNEAFVTIESTSPLNLEHIKRDLSFGAILRSQLG